MDKGQIAFDNQMKELKELYAASLPGKLNDIKTAATSLAIQDNSRDEHHAVLKIIIAKTHNLAGSAGSFGFGLTGKIARELEANCESILKEMTATDRKKAITKVNALVSELMRTAKREMETTVKDEPIRLDN